MSALQLEYFRQRLLTWRADLVEESKQTIENLKDEVRDVGDEAERATRETENSLELRTRDPVSYTHLDVYKRQAIGCADQLLAIPDHAPVDPGGGDAVVEGGAFKG